MTTWPTNFDFNKDIICQSIFKPFIEDEMEKLKAYDLQRPDGVTYIFHEHARRVADDVRKTCLYLGLGEIVANNMYWASLPHDIGKRALPVDVWDSEEKPTDRVKEFRRSHTQLGLEIVENIFHEIKHPFKDLMAEIIAYHHEQMDGKGISGIPATKLSLPVRLVAIVEAFDGYCIWRPHFAGRDISVQGVINKMMENNGKDIYDMALFDSFAEMKLAEYKKD